jgi:hypothetical protein
MSTLSKPSFGLSSRLLLLLLVLTSTASCSSGALGILTGGGPNVAANTQAGKTNSQTIGTTNNISPSVSDSQVDKVDQRVVTTRVASDKVDVVTVNETPPWLVIALVVWSIFLWQLPSPSQIGNWFSNLFGRRR